MKMSKDKKLSKTAKAALPFFALFAGQGFASVRNPLSMQSSKKLAGKSVVYINDIDIPIIPALNATQQANSPFAAFTNKAVDQTKNTPLDTQSKAMRFLHKNHLLSSNKIVKSNTSGNIQNIKTFSDDWNWSTRINFPTTSYFFSTCPTSNTQAISFIAQQATSTYICSLQGPSGSLGFWSGPNSAFVNEECRQLHKQCDLEPLPIELIKFERE